MTIAQIKKNMKHGDYNILQKLLKLSTESAARQKFLRGDKDALEGMIKIQENRSIFCDLHADEDCSCHDDLKEAINQKADRNHSHDWNEITGKPTEFPPTHHSHDVRDIEGLDDVLHTIDDIRNLSNQKLDRDGSNATGSLASTINNSHNHVNKAILDTITSSKVNDWDNAASKAHNAVILGSNATGLTITNQVLQFSNGYQLPTTIKVSEWDDAYLKRHAHGNKTVLDNLTQSVIDQSHAHSNKSVIDGITTQMVNNWNGSFTNSHTHNNKSTLDGISSADVTNWDTAHANNHMHTNKVILDAITAAYTVAEKNKLATIQPNAQVNVKADWHATSGDAEILNKPTSFIPASHNHAISDVAGLQSELNSKLETPHLNGFVHDVAYNSSLHTLTFYQRNEPNIVIDLPIEHLIKGVQLHGNDLVFTFEDGSNVTIPMNTLLVGVVKSVNGLVANSQGEVVLDITDIPGLQSVLSGKANTSGYYPNLSVGQADNGILWNGARNFSYAGSVPVGAIDGIFVKEIGNNDAYVSDKSSIKNWLGISALNLQEVTDNGYGTTNPIVAEQLVSRTQLVLDNNDSDYKALRYNTNGVIRWYLYTQPGEETGGDYGSDLYLARYNDAGTYLGNVVRVNRRTGDFFFSDNIKTSTHWGSYEWGQAYEATQNLNNNFIKGSNSSSVIGNFNFAVGTNGTSNFIQSHSSLPLEINPLGNNVSINNVTISGSNVYSGDITATSGNKTLTFDNIENYGQPLRLNANGNLGIYLQANATNQMIISSGAIDILEATRFTGDYLFFKEKSQNLGIYFNPGSDGRLNINKHSNYSWTGDLGFINYSNGNLHWISNITTNNFGSADQWNEAYNKVQNAFEKESVNFSLNANSFDLGLFSVTPATGGLPEAQYGVVYCYKAATTWWFQQFKATNGNIWERRAVNPSGVTDWGNWVKTNANFSVDNYVQNFDTVNGIGFGGGLDVNPYFHNTNTTNYVYLASKDWVNSQGFISGNHTHAFLSGWADTRNINTIPDDYNGRFESKGIKVPTLYGLPNISYANVFGYRGWQDASGGNAIEFVSHDEDFYFRQGWDTSWGDLKKFWHNGNFDPDKKANIDGSNLTNIANWRSVLGVPTNNNQLSNGAGYITASALNGYASQSWVNSQGFLTSASLPNVSNATITYQGTGAITGGGSHTINQSGNSAYNFDLTNQTKNQISLGVNAYNSLSSKQDTLVAGSGISIIGNTISATGSGGGGIVNIATDSSVMPGPTASQVPMYFNSHVAYGLPETDIANEFPGNLDIVVETGDTMRFYGSYDNVYTVTERTGGIVDLDIKGNRAHIYNVVFQSSGSTGGTVRFDRGIYTGDQINITVPRGQQITIQSSVSIVSPYGNGGGFECQTHANLIWDPKVDAWILVSYS